jgi:hypothetical protein
MQWSCTARPNRLIGTSRAPTSSSCMSSSTRWRATSLPSFTYSRSVPQRWRRSAGCRAIARGCEPPRKFPQDAYDGKGCRPHPCCPVGDVARLQGCRGRRGDGPAARIASTVAWPFASSRSDTRTFRPSLSKNASGGRAHSHRCAGNDRDLASKNSRIPFSLLILSPLPKSYVRRTSVVAIGSAGSRSAPPARMWG